MLTEKARKTLFSVIRTIVLLIILTPLILYPVLMFALNEEYTIDQFVSFILTVLFIVPLVIVVTLYTRTNSLRKRVRTVFHKVIDGEGFIETDTKECRDLLKQMTLEQHSADLFWGMTLFRYIVAFKRQDKNRTCYLCFADWYYVLFVLSPEVSYPVNTLVELKNYAISPGPPMKATATLKARTLESSQPMTLPRSIDELILRCAGTYPVTGDLRTICLGRGGFCIIVKETKKHPDIYELIKFSRELADIVEQEKELNSGAVAS